MAKAKVKPKAQPKAKAAVKKQAKKPVKKSAAKPAKKPVAKPAQKASKNKAVSKSTVKKVTKSNAKIAIKPANKTISKPVNIPTKAVSRVTPAKAAKKPTKPKKVKLPEGYRPTDKEEYMSDSQVEYFRLKLVAWKDELKSELHETLTNLKEENWQEPDITDRATVEIDTGLELRTRDRYRKLINKIDDALFRIDRGEYGYCEETGEEIGIKRLEARPIATLSVEAQERHERDERTHYDEDMEERQ